jgi:hypothetical protein
LDIGQHGNIRSDDRGSAVAVRGHQAGVRALLACDCDKRCGIGANRQGVADQQSAVALSEQNADCRISHIADCDIQFAIAIEIGDGHRAWIGADAISNRRLECTIANATKNSDGVIAGMSDKQIRNSATTQISQSHG